MLPLSRASSTAVPLVKLPHHWDVEYACSWPPAALLVIAGVEALTGFLCASGAASREEQQCWVAAGSAGRPGRRAELRPGCACQHICSLCSRGPVREDRPAHKPRSAPHRLLCCCVSMLKLTLAACGVAGWHVHGSQGEPSSSNPQQSAAAHARGSGLKGGPHVDKAAGRSGCAACCSDALLVATLVGEWEVLCMTCLRATHMSVHC
jgi:hypothetical protein